MAHLAHMIVTINAMHAHLKILTSVQTNKARPKRNQYCCIFGSNYTLRSKTCLANKEGHQEEEYYNKWMDFIENRCERRLGGIVNKIEISNPKISLINYIDTPTKPTSTNMLAIV